MMLGSYFWGYLVTTLPGGLLAETYGGRAVVGWSMAISVVLTVLVPITAQFSYWAVIALRFLTGVAAVSDYFDFKSTRYFLFFNLIKIITWQFLSAGRRLPSAAPHHLAMGAAQREGQIRVGTARRHLWHRDHVARGWTAHGVAGLGVGLLCAGHGDLFVHFLVVLHRVGHTGQSSAHQLRRDGIHRALDRRLGVQEEGVAAGAAADDFTLFLVADAVAFWQHVRSVLPDYGCAQVYERGENNGF